MGLWDWRSHGSSMELSEPFRDTSNPEGDGDAAIFSSHGPYKSARDSYGGSWRPRSFCPANHVRYRLTGTWHQAMGIVLCGRHAGSRLPRYGRHTNDGSWRISDFVLSVKSIASRYTPSNSGVPTNDNPLWSRCVGLSIAVTSGSTQNVAPPATAKRVNTRNSTALESIFVQGDVSINSSY